MRSLHLEVALAYMFNSEFQAIKLLSFLRLSAPRCASCKFVSFGSFVLGLFGSNIPCAAPLHVQYPSLQNPIYSINMPSVFTYRRTSSPRGTRCCPVSHCPGVILGVTENCRRWETLPWPKVTATTMMSRAIDDAAAEEWSPPRQYRRHRKARSWARRWH